MHIGAFEIKYWGGLKMNGSQEKVKHTVSKEAGMTTLKKPQAPAMLNCCEAVYFLAYSASRSLSKSWRTESVSDKKLL